MLAEKMLQGLDWDGYALSRGRGSRDKVDASLLLPPPHVPPRSPPSPFPSTRDWGARHPALLLPHAQRQSLAKSKDLMDTESVRRQIELIVSEHRTSSIGGPG